MIKKGSILNICLLSCSLFLFISCNQTFDPLQKNEKIAFSMYGYLDASADTQWVRITPARNQLDQPLVKPEMSVSVVNPRTGTSTVMSDSLFQLAGGFNAINSWTTLDIKPSETYHIQAERPDGAVSKAIITIPDDFPQPELFEFGGCQATVRVSGVKRLADVQSKWVLQILYAGSGGVNEEIRSYSIPLRNGNSVERKSAEDFSIFVNTLDDMRRIRSQISPPSNVEVVFRVLSRELFVASGGPEWNEEVGDINDIEYALPEGFSNVENGLGYLVGIVSKTVSYIPPSRCLSY